MQTQLNLKEIERKAFRSTYQDGLLDICIGSVVGSMALLMFNVVRTTPLALPGARLSWHMRRPAGLLGGEEVRHPAAHGAGEIWRNSPQAQ
jgi:hypothetical protein